MNPGVPWKSLNLKSKVVKMTYSERQNGLVLRVIAVCILEVRYLDVAFRALHVYKAITRTDIPMNQSRQTHALETCGT